MRGATTITEPLIAVTLFNGLWLLPKKLVYDLGRKNSGLRITVPAGYSSDLASIHGVPNVIWPARGRFDAPAVVHDWLYNTHLVSKPVADAIFYEAMLVAGVPRWRAWVMFTAVRWFGGDAYRRGPDILRYRAPVWAKHIFDTPPMAGREKEAL